MAPFGQHTKQTNRIRQRLQGITPQVYFDHTLGYLLSSHMESSVFTTWDWEQMEKFGFLTETLLVCTHTRLNMPRLWHMPVVVKTMTRRVGSYGLRH